MVRALATTLYYVSFVAGYLLLFQWIIGKDLASLVPGERITLVLIGCFVTAIFCFISEVYAEVQGIRADLLDQLGLK